MVDRQGKNVQSQQNLKQSPAKDDTKQSSSNLLQSYNPGPGQYELNTGFDGIHKHMQQVKHLQNQGVEQMGIQVIKQTQVFQSKQERFDDKILKEKSMIPGPGTYTQNTSRPEFQRNPQQLSFNKSQQQQQYFGGPRIVNPPSIPSHQTVFGYEENDKGQLIKQQSNLVGFTGEKMDKVGPGDYDLYNAQNIVGKNITGVVQWKKPQNVSKKPKENDDKKMPGPGEYNHTQPDVPNKKPMSVFASTVARSGTAVGMQRNRANTALSKGLTGQSKKMMQSFHGKQSLGPLKSDNGQDIDIFDDEDDVAPGPGAYYNPNSSSFKTGKVPERLQFFGSTVERFNGAQQAQKKDGKPLNNIGPGSYQVGTISQRQGQQPMAAFTSNELRFNGPSFSNITPGPGQYQARSLASELNTRIGSKVFGSTQRRFVGNEKKAEIPGPGQYNNAQGAMNKKQAKNKAIIMREQIKKSNSMFINADPNTKQLQAQSYIQQNQIAQKLASKNYQNQIQYDNCSNTIGQNAKRNSESSNPILSVLKAKRNIQTEIGFGSKPPRYSQQKQNVQEKPEDYLGPGYYEQKGGFDQSASIQNVSSKILQNKGTSFVPQAKSCQNFLSNAPRFQHNVVNKPTVPAVVPGPGHYGQSPGDEGSYNPWFKRSYNMLYAQQ